MLKVILGLTCILVCLSGTIKSRDFMPLEIQENTADYLIRQISAEQDEIHEKVVKHSLEAYQKKLESRGLSEKQIKEELATLIRNSDELSREVDTYMKNVLFEHLGKYGHK